MTNNNTNSDNTALHSSSSNDLSASGISQRRLSTNLHSLKESGIELINYHGRAAGNPPITNDHTDINGILEQDEIDVTMAMREEYKTVNVDENVINTTSENGQEQVEGTSSGFEYRRGTLQQQQDQDMVTRIQTYSQPDGENDTSPFQDDENDQGLSPPEDDDVFQDDIDFPEGGFHAWMTVMGSFLGLVSVFGLINSLGSIQAEINRNQLPNVSESKVSLIFSIYLFLCYMLAVQVGPLYDAYGPYHLTVVGTIFFTVGLMTASLAKSYYQFILSFSVCGGIGSALLMTPLVAIVGHWFNRKRGMAMGTATTGGSLGGVVFPIMLRELYGKVGYGWAIRILAFIIFACLVFSLVLMKPRLPQTQFKFDIKTIIDFKTLKDWRFTWLVIANFLGELGVINGLTFLTSYALAQGKSESLSYSLLAILNASGMFGRWFSGWIADRSFGRFNTLMATTTFAFITIFAIWLPFGRNTVGLIVFTILHGLCNGSVLSMVPSCLGQVCRTKDYGKCYGILFLFTSFGILLGIPIASSLIKGDNYDNLVIFNGALYVGTTIALYISRYVAVGNRLCKW